MLNKIVHAAVVGLGIGEQHVSALLTHPNVKLSAICDLDHVKVDSILKKYQLPAGLSKSFSDILNDESINLVSIASFDDDHAEQIMACLNHGKHVFVEKPLCQTPEQLEQIFLVWKKTGLALSSNLVLRKAPLYIWLESAIVSGELGEIYAIDADYLYGRIHKITEGWRSTIDSYSVMAGGGIHMIDLMTCFLVQNPTHVQSCVNKIATRDTKFRHSDFHSAIFNFENGAIGRVTANFGCMHRHQHVLRVFGTRGTFIYDDMGARIHRYRDENAEPEQLFLSPKLAHKGDLLLEFINNIFSGNYKQIAMKEFNLMSIVMAADQSILSEQELKKITYFAV